MRDLTITDHAYHAPGTCMVCGGNQGPFLDTGVDIIGDGRMYLCVKTCLRIAADKAGLSGIGLEELAAGRFDLAQFTSRCTATKVNGERCTALALSGRDVCVAHSKPRVKETV